MVGSEPVALAMKDDWQGNAGDPVIGQGNDQDTYHDFHQLPAKLHDPFFLLPLPKRKRQSVTHISTYSRLSAGSERISWRGFSDRHGGKRPVQEPVRHPLWSNAQFCP